MPLNFIDNTFCKFAASQRSATGFAWHGGSRHSGHSLVAAGVSLSSRWASVLLTTRWVFADSTHPQAILARAYPASEPSALGMIM